MDERALLLEGQLHALQLQKQQLQGLLDAGGVDETFEALRNQLDGTIQALEAELMKQKKATLLAMVSSMGGESSNQQRQEVCHQVEKPTGDGEQDWTRGDRCVVRRWNGQYADAVIEELGSSGGTCLLTWLHPRSKAEQTCKFLKQGSCQWDSRCGFFHGERWKREDLYPCEEGRQVWGDEPPQAGDEVLAKDVDDVWYEGVVEEVLPQEGGSSSSSSSAAPLCMVRFHRKNRTGASETTAVEGDEHHMLPLHFLESLVPSSQRRNHMRVEHDDGAEDYHGVRVLGAVSGDPGEIFTWSSFGKGVGLRLLQRMGYQMGQGLGRGGRGMAEPVEIRVYPPGVSLDYIHEGEDGAKGKVAEFRDVEGKQTDKDGKAREPRKDVFEVINQAINRKSRGEGGEARPAADLHKKEETELRTDIIKEMEKRGQIEGQLAKLHEMLARNEKKDPSFAAQIRQRIGSLEGKLSNSHVQAEKMREAVSKKRDARKQSKHLF